MLWEEEEVVRSEQWAVNLQKLGMGSGRAEREGKEGWGGGLGGGGGVGGHSIPTV